MAEFFKVRKSCTLPTTLIKELQKLSFVMNYQVSRKSFLLELALVITVATAKELLVAIQTT